MNTGQQMLPVWFFIGLLLMIYGIIILIEAVCDWSEPSSVVLARYHAGLWGGVLLLLIGSFYTLWFWPRNRKK